MIYETYDMKAEKKAYREDMAHEAEMERLARLEWARISYAQKYGNDSGFDPYADCEYED